MLLELCVTELEDVATDSQSGRLSSQPVVVESSHPYTDDTSTSGTVKIPGHLVFFCLFSSHNNLIIFIETNPYTLPIHSYCRSFAQATHIFFTMYKKKNILLLMEIN